MKPYTVVGRITWRQVTRDTWRRIGRYTLVSLAVMLLLSMVLGSRSERPLSAATSSGTFEGRLLGPLEANNAALVQVLRDRYLLPPSKEQYQLDDIANYEPEKDGFHINAIKNLFQNPRFVEKGFFVEAGALDGSYLSNTLYLERNLSWTGLLIEPNSEAFQILLQRNRKSWSANVCLSPYPYPYQATLRKLTRADVSKKMIEAGLISMSSLVSDYDDNRAQYGYSTYELSQCFPIESILLALNVSTITMFSLDVEGVEWSILKNFPFHSVRVEVWMVEHRRPEGEGLSYSEDPQFVKWFEERNYTLFGSHHEPIDVRDYIFVHNDGPYASIAANYKI